MTPFQTDLDTLATFLSAIASSSVNKDIEKQILKRITEPKARKMFLSLLKRIRDEILSHEHIIGKTR